MLPDPNGYLGFVYKFLPDELRQVAEAFASGATYSGGSIIMPGQDMSVGTGPQVTQMTTEELDSYIQALRSAAEDADLANNIQEESRLLNRVQELEDLYDEAIKNDRQTVTVVNTDNKQFQTNNTGNTVSVGKDTTPNDPTMKTLQGAGSPTG
mgnify:FL=1